jgi:large conductance mechanosensitive channel
MKNFLEDFKKFMMRGNVLDLAVALIIGTAFGRIVSSLVNDILIPVLGLITGKINYSTLRYVIPNADKSKEIVFKYGMFLQAIIEFLIIAFSVFVMIRILSKFKRKEEVKPAERNKQEVLLEEIRDLLKRTKD